MTIDVEAVLDSYLETLIWQGNDWNDMDENDNPADLDRFDSRDFDEKAIEKSREDVEGFLEAVAKALGPDAFDGLEPPSRIPSLEVLIGHKFCLSRMGHGTGFFDSGATHADRLQELSRPFGDVHLYVYEEDGEEKLGIG